VKAEAAASPPTSPDQAPDLKTKLKTDWETIKHDTRKAGQDIKNAFRRLRDWLTP
jgi:hypothetical protein